MEEQEGKKEEKETDYRRLQSYPLIRHSDMNEEMRTETMELCVTACEKFANNNESAAKMIKETMDKKFGASWHAIVGEGYGFEIAHEDCSATVPWDVLYLDCQVVQTLTQKTVFNNYF